MDSTGHHNSRSVAKVEVLTRPALPPFPTYHMNIYPLAFSSISEWQRPFEEVLVGETVSEWVRRERGGYISVSLPVCSFVQVMEIECKIVKADDEALEASGVTLRPLWGGECGELASSRR